LRLTVGRDDVAQGSPGVPAYPGGRAVEGAEKVYAVC
jgi:hypothetical protein